VSEQDRPDRGAPADDSRLAVEPADYEQGGEPACWAHLICPDCGSMISEGHRSGCEWNGADTATREG
jgi:hypothetical protein